MRIREIGGFFIFFCNPEPVAADNGTMHPAWIYLLSGWLVGFHGLAWAAPAVLAWRWLGARREPARLPWLPVLGLLAAVAAWLSAGWAAPRVPAGSRMTVTGHRLAGARELHVFRDAAGRGRRLALAEPWAVGSVLWVPVAARLPVIPLRGDRLRQAPRRPPPSLVGSLTLGHPAPPSLRAQLRFAGLSHVLAISGLHLALVSLAVLAGLGRLHRWLPARWGIERRWLEVGACVPFVWWYRALTGGAVSTTRAAIMMTLWVVGSRFWGAGGLWTGLAWAAAGLWVWDPACWRDPGFQLSFGAVAGIAAALRWVPRRPLAGTIAASVGASLATAPIVWLQFGRISPMFLINNLLFVPLFSLLIIPGAFAVVALSFLLPAVGYFLWRWADVFCLALAGPLGAWNRAWPEWTPAGSAVWTLVLGAAAIWVVRGAMLRRAVVALPVALAFILLPWGRVDDSAVRLTFFHARGESSLVRLPGGRTLLVDAGAAGLPAALARRGVTRLDRVVITHSHADHLQELERLADEVELEVVWVGPRFPEGLRRRLRGRGIRVAPMPPCARLGEAVLRLRSPHDSRGPAPPPSWSENDASLVIELAVAGRTFWFLGDAEAAAEERLIRDVPAPGRVDLVKVAHHGRITSSTAVLWEWIRPGRAVICGEGASSVVLDRLESAGSVVHRVLGSPLDLSFAPLSGARERETECEREP